MELLPQEHAKLIHTAIQTAQEKGELPEFDIPEILITPPKNPEHGDYACSVAMQLAKVAQRKPLDIANAIVQQIPETDFIASIDIAPPGFINFRLSDTYLKNQIEQIIEEDEQVFQLDFGEGKRAQVEFVSANPSGPITVGHTRGAIIGDTMARLLEACSYEVEREYYFNNAGNQMIILGNSLKYRYLQELGINAEAPPEESFYQGDYLVDVAKALATEKGDALVDANWEPFKDYAEQKMFEWIKKSLKQIGIEHDYFFNENSLFENKAIWNTLETLEQNGYIYKSATRADASEEEKAQAQAKGYEPAQWFKSTAFGDDEDRVLVKSDGVPTYTLPDIAYHANKLERKFDVLVNVLGSDHYTQHQVVKYGLQALQYNPSCLHVILNQMVRLMKDGEEVKMGKRSGNFITLDELVEMTSADVVRYMILARSPKSQLDFDLDLAVKQSNENPVYYIQNAHVRCAGILREAEARDVSDEGADVQLLGEDELAFLRKVMEMGTVIQQAVENYEPHKIAFYAHDLASNFHPTYEKVRALHSEVPEDLAKARLRFYRAAKVVFNRLLNLMGMSAPERM